MESNQQERRDAIETSPFWLKPFCSSLSLFMRDRRVTLLFVRRCLVSARIQRIQASLGALQPEDKEERQALLTALERRPKDKPRCLQWSNRFTPRRSIWPERRNASCNTMRQMLQPERRCSSRTRQRSRCARCRRPEGLLRKLKTQVADSTLPMPIADPVGEVARLQQVVADLHNMPLQWSLHRVFLRSHQFLLFAFGRGRTMCQTVKKR